MQTLDSIYQKPATCLSILRIIPAIPKQIIMRLLYASSSKNTFTNNDTNLLLSLYIIRETQSNISINEIFQKSLHEALVGSGSHSSFGLPDEHAAKTVNELDKFALDSWQSVLYSLVGSHDSQKPKVNG